MSSSITSLPVLSSVARQPLVVPPYLPSELVFRDRAVLATLPRGANCTSLWEGDAKDLAAELRSFLPTSEKEAKIIDKAVSSVVSLAARVSQQLVISAGTDLSLLPVIDALVQYALDIEDQHTLPSGRRASLAQMGYLGIVKILPWDSFKAELDSSQVRDFQPQADKQGARFRGIILGYSVPCTSCGSSGKCGGRIGEAIREAVTVGKAVGLAVVPKDLSHSARYSSDLAVTDGTFDPLSAITAAGQVWGSK